jgi:N-methylhydantoinase B/oxoprolinase/acetone carboxylase alpha subunit
MDHIRDNAEEKVRQAIEKLKPGSFTYNLDNGAHIKVTISIDKEKREATVDFTGTSAQLRDNFNAPLAITRAAVLYVFRTLVGENIPMNDGCLEPIHLETSQCITDCLYGALGVIAGSQGTMNNFTFGDNEFQYYETICGGSGAGPNFHGTDAIHTHMTNSKLTDPEVLENRYPVMLESFSIKEGTGGHGLFHGGNGVVRKVKFLRPMSAAILSNHRKIAPFGLHGGQEGATGKTSVLRLNGKVQTLASSEKVHMEAGESFIIQTPGGGGFGREEPEP